MIHGREDYNRIQDPSGKIPEGEPVFLLRAQDPVAAMVVRIYYLLTRDAGSKEDIVLSAAKQADAMEEWNLRLVDQGTEKPADL